MICAQCRATNDADAAFCRNCGARLGGPATYQASSPTGPDATGWPAPHQTLAGNPASSAPADPAGRHAMGTASASTAFGLDLRRLSPVEWAVGGASVVVLISLFMPWFGLSVDGIAVASISGVTAHGYLYLVLILALAIIGYLVLRAGWDQLPVTLPIAHGPLLLVGTGMQFLLVLIGFLDKPLAVLSWDAGAYLGLIAAIVAAGPVIAPAVRSFQSSD